MADVKITTPDGNLPAVSSPKEGVDYFVSPDKPVHHDLILRDGKTFTQFIGEIPKSPDQVEPPPPPKTPFEKLVDDIALIKAKLGV